jgi:hypothetical protein
MSPSQGAVQADWIRGRLSFTNLPGREIPYSTSHWRGKFLNMHHLSGIRSRAISVRRLAETLTLMPIAGR